MSVQQYLINYYIRKDCKWNLQEFMELNLDDVFFIDAYFEGSYPQPMHPYEKISHEYEI